MSEYIISSKTLHNTLVYYKEYCNVGSIDHSVTFEQVVHERVFFDVVKRDHSSVLMKTRSIDEFDVNDVDENVVACARPQ